VTANAKRFVAANAASPVVAGIAKGKGGEGAVYILADGKRFELSREECESVVPRWAL
jgi:hypothetical protein